MTGGPPDALPAIRARLGPRRLVTLVAMVAGWCALWGEVSVANIASGLAVAVAVLATGIGTAGRGTFRLWPLAQLTWLVATDLFVSTVEVAREVLTPVDHTEEAIVAVDLPPVSRGHLLLLSGAVTVTPGTAVVDVDAERCVLYVHLLHARRRAAVEAHVRKLAEVAARALPGNGADGGNVDKGVDRRVAGQVDGQIDGGGSSWS